MNLIKFKDMIMPGESAKVEIYNKYLKNKYAYWIQMRYVVAFDFICFAGYVASEEDDKKLFPQDSQNPCCPTNFAAVGVWPNLFDYQIWDTYKDLEIMQYVDQVETERINSINEFEIKNSYTTDKDITIDDLKIFRTWLATELLKFDKNEQGVQKNELYTEKTTRVLNYYKNNMYDDVIKGLIDFSQVENKLSVLQAHKQTCCSCQNDIDLNYLLLPTNDCNPINIYKHNIYMEMINIFSDIDFWTQFPIEFIKEFKTYIDNIISTDLILFKSKQVSDFVDCNCVNYDEQEQMKDILKRLSQSLNYIINNEISGHKNLINDTLIEWSSKLYENMYWS